MYKLPQFTETDQDKVLNFMQQHAFVTLIGNDGMQTAATQIPVLIETNGDEITLRGHIMRKTDHHKAIKQNKEVLVLFQGPHCYVSSSWYTEKMGATWNYQTVQTYGTVSMLSDEETIELLRALTEKYESPQEAPLFMHNLPEGYAQGLVKAIAGLEIKLHDIHPIFKLSQNRDDESYINIVTHLLKTNDTDAHKVAAEMKRRRPQLF